MPLGKVPLNGPPFEHVVEQNGGLVDMTANHESFHAVGCASEIFCTFHVTTGIDNLKNCGQTLSNWLQPTVGVQQQRSRAAVTLMRSGFRAA